MSGLWGTKNGHNLQIWISYSLCMERLPEKGQVADLVEYILLYNVRKKIIQYDLEGVA